MKKGRNIKIIKLDPKYEDDKKDKGVKWSIVGKTEQFLAVRNKNR